MNSVRFCCILLICFLNSLTYAEKDPVKFGKVSIEELQMTTYGPDTSASAVILCDYGNLNIDNFTFTQVTRIKILKKSGYDQANITFPAYRNANVRGITFNLENGQIVKSKLESSAIFTENLYRNIERLRIAMPDIRVGTVFDIEFTYIGIPDYWEFQREIPVVHSELFLRNHPNISFRKSFVGFEPIKVIEDGHWIAENMPAFHEETYINSPFNYMTRLNFEITELRFGTYFRSFAKSWETICKYLDEQENFGVPFSRDAYLNAVAKEIRAKAGSDEERLKLAHEYIKTFRWNKTESLLTTAMNLSTALDKKSGNSSEINLALVQLLRKLGFNANPVIMSSRDNGELSYLFPCYWKLNYVIAQVRLNDKEVLMDGTEKHAPYYLLPERSLNKFGMSFNKEKSEPVIINPDRKEKETVLYTMTMDNDLRLQGTLGFQRVDYASLDFRNRYEQFSSQESYLENMMNNFPGMKIQSVKIENLDSLYLPLRDEYEITLKNMVDAMDGKIYLYPLLLHRLHENPFKPEQRKYPVDFAHKIEKIYTVKITLPENVEVISWPETVKMGLPDNSAYFLYQLTPMGNSINLSYKLVINNPVFSEKEYPDLREFYNQIIAKHNEPVILKRKD